MKEMKEVMARLMGEFTVESMMGCDIEIEPMPQPSERADVALLQQQCPTWCLQSKRLLLTDQVEPLSPQGLFASHAKARITKYLACKAGAENKAMKHLHTCRDMALLARQIGMLARHALYKDVEDIAHAGEEIRRNSLDPEHVSVPIAIYVLFAMLANDGIGLTQFNELFFRSWYDYYENWMARELLFQMSGEKWKACFEGVLMG